MSFFDDASLAFLPSGAAGKDGKAYSIKPTDGTGDFTFSRGSNLAATRVGADGLIEKGRENLLTYSNDFSQWTKLNTTTTSGQSGYDGSSDATEVSFTAGSSRAIGKGGLVTSVVNFSVYVKAGTHDVIQFTPSNSATTFANFDISASNPATGNTGGLVVDSSIEDIGGGWYRCSAVLNNSGSGTMWIWIVDSLTSGRAASVSTDGTFFVQDAQLEIGLAATDYIESGATTGKAGLLEDEPRFDYSGGATCPSLLLEPSRTNLVTNSEYNFLVSNTSLTYNNATSPEGEENATLVEVTSSGTGRFVRTLDFTCPTTFSVSAFVKRVNNQWVQLLGTQSGMYVNFDIQNGVIGDSGNKVQANSENIEDYGNGWYRVSATFSGVVSTNSVRIYAGSASTDAYATGSSTAGDQFLVYGFQAEQGSYLTSYIPNHSGGTITRGADFATKTGLTSSINSTEGTMFLDFKALANTLPSEYSYFSMSDGTYNNRISILQSISGTNQVRAFAFVGGTKVFDLNDSVTDITTQTKVAVRYANNAFDLFINGAKVATDTSGSIFPSDTLDRVSFSEIGTTTSTFKANVNQVLVFQETLSDADCISLTTL